MKINSNFKVFAGTNFNSAQYVESPAFGVNRFMLDRIGEEKARATTIVEYKPNSPRRKFPKHTHIGGEEFLVLSGRFMDQFGEFPEGTYIRNPIGSEHAPWVEEDGCTIMVKLLQMAETGEGTAPLHIDLAKAKIESNAMDYGTVSNLYKNDQTGETVEMCWLNAGSSFPVDDLCNGGEELFVVDGSLVLDETTVYSKWGWLRFPTDGDSRRSTLKAGDTGAQIYRKTGHLTETAMSMEKIQINDDETMKTA